MPSANVSNSALFDDFLKSHQSFFPPYIFTLSFVYFNESHKYIYLSPAPEVIRSDKPGKKKMPLQTIPVEEGSQHQHKVLF